MSLKVCEYGLLVQSREWVTLDHTFWNGKRLAIDVIYLLQEILLGLKMVGQKKIKVVSKGSLTRFRPVPVCVIEKKGGMGTNICKIFLNSTD